MLVGPPREALDCCVRQLDRSVMVVALDVGGSLGVSRCSPWRSVHGEGVNVGSYGGEERLLSFSLGVLNLLLDSGCLTVDVSKVLFVELGSDLLVVELADDTFIPGSPRRVSIRSVGSRWRRSIFVVVWMTLHAPWNRWMV